MNIQIYQMIRELGPHQSLLELASELERYAKEEDEKDKNKKYANNIIYYAARQVRLAALAVISGKEN